MNVNLKFMSVNSGFNSIICSLSRPSIVTNIIARVFLFSSLGLWFEARRHLSLCSKLVGEHHRQKKRILIAVAIIFLLTPVAIEQDAPRIASFLFSLVPTSSAVTPPSIATLQGTDLLENNTFITRSANYTSDGLFPYAVGFNPNNAELYVADLDNEADLGGGITGSLLVSVMQEPSNQLIGYINVTLPASLSVKRPYYPESVA